MNTINEFRNYVTENLEELLPKELIGNATILAHNVEKNNGLVLHSIAVMPENGTIAPNLYVDSFYERYKDGASIDDLMEEIKEVVIKNLDAPKEFKDVAKEFQNFEAIKDRIVMVAVNTERNAKLLSEIPHTEKEDLSLIYKVMVGNDFDGIATVTIRNEHMNLWGVSLWGYHCGPAS